MEEGSDPLAGLTPEELKEHPVVKGLLATTAEAHRRERETWERNASLRALEEQRRTELNQIKDNAGLTLARGVERDVIAAIIPLVKKWEASGDGEFNIPQGTIANELRKHFNALVPAAVASSFENGKSMLEEIRKEKFPTYRPDEGDMTALHEASLKGDGKAMVALTAMMLVKANQESVEQTIRADERAKVIREMKGQQGAKQAVEQTRARQSRPQPTQVPTQPSQNGLKSAYEQVQKMSNDAFYRLPAARQKELMDKADEYERTTVLAGSR